jgi:uncharacterized coiled-coil protein SlyX
MPARTSSSSSAAETARVRLRRVAADPTTNSREDETAVLQSRVSELEAQLAEQTRATAALVAEAQEKLYWLERWHVDLDALMRKRGAMQTLELVRGARRRAWQLRRLKRRLLR